MPITPQQDLDAHVAQIIETDHPKKLIVAGAGAGKTFTFSKLLAALPASAPERRLVITFLGGLKRDLEKDLGAVARVQTFHGYCFALLKQNADIREAAGFTDAVRYFPRTVSLIKRDWALAVDKQPTLFVPALRQLAWGAEVDFFLARGSYYDAIGYAADSAGPHDAVWHADEEAVLVSADARIRLDRNARSGLVGDVLLVRPSQGTVQRMIRAASRHNYFLVTEQCDQLCIMCSQPPKKTHHDQYEHFADAVSLAPPDCLITITGGEPTLHKDKLFDLLEGAAKDRPDVHFQVLSNGQHFGQGDISRLRPLANTTSWGTPLYAASSLLHDEIVGKAGAHRKLEEGLAILAQSGVPIELRTVILRTNVRNLEATASFVASNLSFVRRWAIMQLERAGFGKNRWPDLFYDSSQDFGPIGPAIDIARAGDIETLLYNFPLCTVPSAYRRFALSTISDWKRKYLAGCIGCAIRDQCGGFFEWYPQTEGFARIGLQ